MHRVFFNLAPLAVVIMIIQGCMASSYVSSIGARTINASSPNQPIVQAQLYDSELVASDWGLFPYVLEPKFRDQKLKAGKLEVNYDEIEWSTESVGSVVAIFQGVPTVFSVTKTNNKNTKKVDQLVFESRYRESYGYASQSLLIASIPVDVVVTSTAIVATVVISPIVYVYKLVVE